jgi:PAS domain S-box-containing protein
VPAGVPLRVLFRVDHYSISDFCRLREVVVQAVEKKPAVEQKPGRLHNEVRAQLAGLGSGFTAVTPMTEKQVQDTILDSIADGVFTVDQHWRITSFNAAAEAITGVPREEAIGQPCCDVFRASICESECALRQTMHTGCPITCKPIYIVRADGAKIPISISTAILKDKQGRVIGGVETFRDLSVVEQLRKELEQTHSFADIIARSASMRKILDILPQLGESSSTVLIEGASGTGKELFARAIHNFSPRKNRPFVAINCGALPDTLLESELFGYKAGAFTDARQDKPGRFSLADTGSIFLDEIGDISAAMQSKLLRVLQESSFEPLGSVDTTTVDVRVIAATNKDLARLVADGVFREDLYYRINVVQLQLPPLRDRREDVPLLIDAFIAKFNRLQSKHILGISPEAMAVLLAYDFPGNVRELENIVEHCFVLCTGGMIEPHHLPAHLGASADLSVPGGKGDLTLKALESMHIRQTIRRHQGNRDAAAKALGIHRATLFRKIKALGIDPSDDPPSNS